MFELPVAAAVYCALVGTVFLTTWLYYDRREHARFEIERRRITFHCIRCGRLYTSAAGAETCRCPGCGHENIRLKF